MTERHLFFILLSDIEDQPATPTTMTQDVAVVPARELLPKFCGWLLKKRKHGGGNLILIERNIESFSLSLDRPVYSFIYLVIYIFITSFIHT